MDGKLFVKQIKTRKTDKNLKLSAYIVFPCFSCFSLFFQKRRYDPQKFRKYILNAETQRMKSFYVTFRVMLKHSLEVAERLRSTQRTHRNAFGISLRTLDGRRKSL